MAEIKKISTELQLLDKFLDTSGDAGTSGQVLTSTGTGINWTTPTTGTVTGTGVTGILPYWTNGPGGVLGDSIVAQGSQRIQISSGGGTLLMGQWDGSNNRIESASRPLLITSYTSPIKLGISGNTTMTIESSNVGIGTTSPIDELHVEGVIQSKKQLLPSTSGTAGWYKIGTMSGFVQGGATAVLEIAGHSGYNALNNQDYLIKLFIKTSNASSVGPDGQKFNSWYERTGGNNSTIEFKWNNSATNDYDLYMFIPTHSLRSWYSIKKGTGTWDHVGTSASDPGANSSTVLKATGLFNILDANVGIRTANATDTLTVNGNLSIFGNKIYNGSASNSAGVSFPNSTTRIDGYSGITFHSSTTTVGSQSERMRITNAGNVGINTTSPVTFLDVRGTSTALPATSGTTVSTGTRLRIASTAASTLTASLDMGLGTSSRAWIQSTSIGDLSDGNRLLLNPNGGDVGIGTSSPATILHLAKDNAVLRIEATTNGQNCSTWYRANGNNQWETGCNIGAGTDYQIYDRLNGASRIVVGHNGNVTIPGNVGIGTTSPGAKLQVAGEIRAADGNKGTPSYTFTSDTNTGMFSDTADVLEFTVGGNTNLQIRSGYLDITQYIRHVGDADTYFGFTAANQFQVIAGGNTNLNVQGNGVDLSYAGSTRLTTQTGGIAITGDLTVTADVGIGLTNPDVPLHVTANEDGSGIDKGAAKFINTNTGQGATTMHMVQTSSSNFANAVKFWQGSTPTAVGFIRLTTSATQFITSASDLNLKKNITIWSDDTLGKFKALEPKKFRFKTQDVSEDKTLGFIAQNEVDNFPEAYPQFLGDDEKPYYGFNPTGMVPHLMKAIKDLVEKVETLENKITQLENNN